MSTPVYKKAWFLTSVVAVIVSTIVLVNRSSDKNKSGENNETELEAFYRAEEAKPCINPPLKGVNISYTTYGVNAGKGGAFDFKTGSKIVIPANAFVDENGKNVEGEIELKYREFHDAVDFFVAGIPMTYDSAGVRYQFESAGMMEMLAFQNGKKISIADGKSINIELASKHKGTEYNLYKLDTFQNNWSCLGKDKVVDNALETLVVTVDLEKIPEIKTITSQKEETKKEKEMKIAALRQPKPEPKVPLKASKEKYTFNIDVDAKEFPELAVFRNVLFEVGPENKDFNKALYDVTWDEVTVKEGTIKGQNYWLTLKKDAQNRKLLVYPVLEGKTYEKALSQYQENLDKYTVALEKRKFDERLIELDYKSKIENLKKQQKQIELKWKEIVNKEFAEMETEQKVKRMFAINSFGVYNCDNPIAYPTGVSCTANLVNDKNEKVKCYDVFLVDRSKNALFTFIKNPITKFSFNPQSANLLWTVENDVLYWLKPEQFSEIKGTEEITNLKMNRVDKKFKTVEELKEFLNF